MDLILWRHAEAHEGQEGEDDLLRLTWIADPQIAPDGRRVAFSHVAGGAEADGLLFDSSHGDGETKFRRGPWKTILAGGISQDNLASALVF